MNWLAHAFLSEPDVEARLGNLLADHIKGRDREGVSESFRRGLKLHQVIDSFTDFHPIVHRSRARIGPGWPHLAGVFIDVFYDHFLAVDWERYSSESLDSFTTRIYAEFRSRPVKLPAEAGDVLERVVQNDALGSYRTLDGIEATLHRVSRRLFERTGRDLSLERGIVELTMHFDDINRDFGEFFPALQERVARFDGT